MSKDDDFCAGEGQLFARFFDSGEEDFEAELANFMDSRRAEQQRICNKVAKILQKVATGGDAAWLALTARYDGFHVRCAENLRVNKKQLQQWSREVSASLHENLKQAAERIQQYAEHQKLSDWSYTDEWGNILGQKITCVPSVGIYVPGGKAAYPSTVLMNGIPAKVAGVPRVVMMTPSKNREILPLVASAALLAEIDEVYFSGGAQAIAALAFGTETMPKVAKIVGPGNLYVAEAKRQVYGHVGTDMPCGPSELLVVADASCNPTYVAADLLAQAEHDEEAQTILLSTHRSIFTDVAKELAQQLVISPRHEIISASLANHGLWILCPDIAACARIANCLAPEHLQLSFADAASMQHRFINAGALFIGHRSFEVLGDYCAGPNHVLPTAKGALFHSPLGTYDFQKRTSIIQCSEEGAKNLAKIAKPLAQAEGLHAHAHAALLRIDS